MLEFILSFIYSECIKFVQQGRHKRDFDQNAVWRFFDHLWSFLCHRIILRWALACHKPNECFYHQSLLQDQWTFSSNIHQNSPFDCNLRVDFFVWLCYLRCHDYLAHHVLASYLRLMANFKSQYLPYFNLLSYFHARQNYYKVMILFHSLASHCILDLLLGYHSCRWAGPSAS